MTEKQKRFADEYLIDLNATQAAIRAGYSEKTANRIASENLSKLDIQEYIEEQLKQLHNSSMADAQEVIAYLTSVLRGKSKSSVVVGTPIGVQEISKTPDEKERLKAAELLGKYYALFTDRTQVEGIAQVQIIDDIPEGGADEQAD